MTLIIEIKKKYIVTEYRGVFAILGTDEFLDEIGSVDEFDVNHTLKAAGINARYDVDMLMVEDLKRVEQFLIVSIFGEGWISLAREMVTNARNIEVYSAIYSDYIEYYFALNREEVRYISEREIEDSSYQPGLDEWKALVPMSVAVTLE